MGKKEDDEESIVKPITIPRGIWKGGVIASEDALGSANFSGYVRMLIVADCKKRGIKV